MQVLLTLSVLWHSEITVVLVYPPMAPAQAPQDSGEIISYINSSTNDSGLWHFIYHRVLELLWGEGFLLFFFKNHTKAKQNTNPRVCRPPSHLCTPSPSHRDLSLPWQTEPGPALCLCRSPATHQTLKATTRQPRVQNSPKTQCRFLKHAPADVCRHGMGNPGYVVCSLQVFLTASHVDAISTLPSWKETSVPFKYLLKKEYL